MPHKYPTRYRLKHGDSYLKEDSDDSQDSDSDYVDKSSEEDMDDSYSSSEHTSELQEELEDLVADAEDDDEDDAEDDDDEDYEDEEEEDIDGPEPTPEEKKVIKKKAKEASDAIISLLLNPDEDGMDMDMAEEEAQYLKTLTSKQKKELLELEKQIALVNKKDIPLRYRVLTSQLPIEIKASAIKKLDAIKRMTDISNEYHKIQHWLDGLMMIPFGHYIQNTVTIASDPVQIADYLVGVKEILDSSVYSHVEAKSTLLEIVASWITNPTAQPTVIGLQGPPGTGKTTLIKDGVARALGRPFSMISLGGATDSAFLEGHSYTYEGSNWGRLAQILMDAKCMNPIIYFDELDKVSETKHGEEIIGVLTHLIDYSQNNWIQDRYFSGIPLDFSRCLFIFSFNDEYRINPILKDRIHIIRTDPSNAENKLVIAKDYLIPKLLENVGFQREDILFPDATIQYIIQNFTNGEDGVRNLKRCLDSIILKLNTLRLTYQNPKLSSSPSTSIIPYYLNNYALPMTITVDVVDTLVKGTSLKQKSNEKLHMMYM